MTSNAQRISLMLNSSGSWNRKIYTIIYIPFPLLWGLEKMEVKF